LNGPIFTKEDAINNSDQIRALFLNKYFECFVSTFSDSSGVQIHEYLNFASLIENMIASKNIIHINLQLVDAFFGILCCFVIKCFKEETILDTFESYEKVLIAWTSIKSFITLNQLQEELIFQKFSQTIFNGFIETRLNNFEKNNPTAFQEEIILNNDKSDGDESDNCPDNDLDCYKEVLFSIGVFAKYSLDYCLPLLSK
jgi:hypothetical protein